MSLSRTNEHAFICNSRKLMCVFRVFAVATSIENIVYTGDIDLEVDEPTSFVSLDLTITIIII